MYGVRLFFQSRSATASILQTLVFKIFTLAINIGTGVITARYLGPEGRGEQAAMIMWPLSFPHLLTLGLPSALLYNLKLYPKQKSEFFVAALILGTCLGFVATFIGIICVPYWLNQYSPDIIQTTQWFMMAAPLSLLGLIFVAALESQENFIVANRSRYLIPQMTLIILLVLVWGRNLTPTTSGLANILPFIPIVFWLLSHLWHHFQLNWTYLMRSFPKLNWFYKKLINYGVRSYGVDILRVLSLQIDQVLVLAFLTPGAMGIYTVALSISRIIDVLQDSIVTVLLPKTAARPLKDIIQLTEQAARINLILSTLGVLILNLISPILLSLFYGSEFQQALTILPILLIEVTIGSLIRIKAQAFMAADKPGIVTILQILGISFSFPLMILLVPKYQLLGVSMSLLIATIARFIFILINGRLTFKIPILSLLIKKEDFNFLLEKIIRK